MNILVYLFCTLLTTQIYAAHWDFTARPQEQFVSMQGSPQGLLVVSSNQRDFVVDAQTGKILFEKKSNIDRRRSKAAIAHHQPIIAIPESRDTVLLININDLSKTIKIPISFVTSEPMSFAFSLDDTKLNIGSHCCADKWLLWDIKNNILEKSAFGNIVTSAEWINDHELVANVEATPVIVNWLTGLFTFFHIQNELRFSGNVVIDPDHQFFAMSAHQGMAQPEIRILDVNRTKVIARLESAEVTGNWNNNMSFTSCHQFIAPTKNNITVWSTKNWNIVKNISHGLGLDTIESLSVSQDCNSVFIQTLNKIKSINL